MTVSQVLRSVLTDAGIESQSSSDCRIADSETSLEQHSVFQQKLVSFPSSKRKRENQMKTRKGRKPQTQPLSRMMSSSFTTSDI